MHSIFFVFYLYFLQFGKEMFFIDGRKECFSYLIYCRALHELRLNMLPDNQTEDCLDEIMFINAYDKIISFLKKDMIGD